jgi:hypothetical protein
MAPKLVAIFRSQKCTHETGTHYGAHLVLSPIWDRKMSPHSGTRHTETRGTKVFEFSRCAHHPTDKWCLEARRRPEKPQDRRNARRPQEAPRGGARKPRSPMGSPLCSLPFMPHPSKMSSKMVDPGPFILRRKINGNYNRPVIRTPTGAML